MQFPRTVHTTSPHHKYVYIGIPDTTEVCTTLPCIVCLHYSTAQSFPPQAHCYYVVLKAFNEAIDYKGLSPANEAIMRKLVFTVCNVLDGTEEWRIHDCE